MKYYNDINKQYHVGIAGMSTDYNMINSAYSSCMSGKTLNKAHIEKLLDINPKSGEAIYLRETAYRAALALTGGEAFLWSTGGLKCIDCEYCRGVYPKPKQNDLKNHMCQSIDRLSANIRIQIENGINMISLSADNFCAIEDICRKAEQIKREINGRYNLQLIIDTDELSFSQINELCASEIDAICITANYGETANNLIARDSQLIYIAECIDSRYSNNKLAELISDCIEKKPQAIMIAEEKSDSYRVSAERAAQIIAVLRLASGGVVKNIGASFLFNKMVISGANIIATGIKNTLDSPEMNLNKEMDLERAKTALRNAGYNILI